MDTGEQFVVKRLRFNANCSPQSKLINDLNSEVNNLQDVQNHPNIVKYLGSETIGNDFCIYLEYMSGGSLADITKEFKEGAIDERVLAKYLKQIVKGLQHLHNKRIKHLDLKGSNILVDAYGKIKISDFGCSIKLENTLTKSSVMDEIKGTVYWCAPEVINQKASRKSDIWSLGCTIIELYTGKHPWPDFELEIPAFLHILNQQEPPDYPKGISFELTQLLNQCFQRDPNARPTCEQILKSPFLKNIK